MLPGPWRCEECYGQACDVCRGTGVQRCTVCSKATAVTMCGSERVCPGCAALVRELEARWAGDADVTSVELPVTMAELVAS